MNIIVWIIFGALAGWVASLVMKTDGNQGPLANIVVGILGAFLGGFIMNLIGEAGVSRFNLRSFIVAVLGSVVLLAVFRAVKR
jgi:uncharacterized membrane protein YeaQ/YmgE (transglycosylase-associated protein family)